MQKFKLLSLHVAQWLRLAHWLVPLFHWVATFGKLFTHIASPGYKKGVFGA